MDKADKAAAQTSREMARLLAAMNYDKGKGSEVKRIRDQAYTHLKEAVDEIRGAGKYLFHQNKKHSLEYTSEYMRHIKSKQKRKPKRENGDSQKFVSKKGGGTPNLFTVSLMPFFRNVISKTCFFCKLLQDISKKRPPG